MNDLVAALSIRLAILTPSPDGWLRIDRVHLAAELGIGRIELARLLTKAVPKLNIEIDGDRIKFLSTPKKKIEVKKVRASRKTHSLQQMLAAVESIMTDYYGTKAQ